VLKGVQVFLFQTLNNKKIMVAKFIFDPTSAGTQLHLFFHDYFVQKCDV
jgi:hypothetical protein